MSASSVDELDLGFSDISPAGKCSGFTLSLGLEIRESLLEDLTSGPVHADIAADSVDDLPAVALAERVGDFNISMDPWEQTGAAPQGWAAHARQTVVPVQGYIQLRPQDTTLPSFGSGPPATAATADTNLSTEVAVRDGGGKASPSVSIFSRSPLCSHTCRHCRCKPCDIATEHDDHICYNCEQRILFAEAACLRFVVPRVCHSTVLHSGPSSASPMHGVGGEDPWGASEG